MALIAGVDSSTQSTKVEVRDLASGAVVGRGSASHPNVTPPVAEQDPAAWWAAFEAAWVGAGDHEVAAISVGGQQHGMVALDAGDRPVHPAKLWNDTESAADATRLVDQLDGGPAGWAAAVGSVPVARAVAGQPVNQNDQVLMADLGDEIVALYVDESHIMGKTPVEVTAKLLVRVGAAFQLLSPAWSAAMRTVPPPVKVRLVPPEMAAGPSMTANETSRPLEAVAASSSALVVSWSAMAGKVIAWSAGATERVSLVVPW